MLVNTGVSKRAGDPERGAALWTTSMHGVARTRHVRNEPYGKKRRATERVFRPNFEKDVRAFSAHVNANEEPHAMLYRGIVSNAAPLKRGAVISGKPVTSWSTNRKIAEMHLGGTRYTRSRQTSTSIPTLIVARGAHGTHVSPLAAAGKKKLKGRRVPHLDEVLVTGDLRVTSTRTRNGVRYVTARPIGI